ncbi:hypothetical protein AB1Y20_009732 [Prymnesium parvum]|uniref:Apple domain-containing protein n=1 Tax=Prymnesium parvum TaxID=97485 RepID=A0AB34K2C5_PRYPA
MRPAACLALMLSLEAAAQLPPGVSVSLVKADVECMSSDRAFPRSNSVEECARHCADSQTNGKKDCRFFIFGKNGTKVGDCYKEDTKSASCAEGWETDFFDFYELKAPWIGCAEPRAINYNPVFVITDESCSEWQTCAESEYRESDSNCNPYKWHEWCEKPCEMGSAGYRNKKYDTLVATKVDRGSIQIDGDLSDWNGFKPYKDIAFADSTGREVAFESFNGGKWFGPTDFSTSWMIAWDESYFYLAIEEVDDVFTVGEPGSHWNTYCWKTGLQLGFEVGGPNAQENGVSMTGVLQARRSSDLGISRLDLINLGLEPGHTSCATTPNMSQPSSSTGARDCCVEYVRSNAGGFSELSKFAIIRNENNKRTYYEAAISKVDLMGTGEAQLSHWRADLTFGFTMAVNDGDDAALQRGWGGYYPLGLVKSWNGGEKEPSKTGRVHLSSERIDRSERTVETFVACSSGDGGGGGGGGGFWSGVFWTLFLLLLGIGLVRAKKKHDEGGMPAVKGWVVSAVPSRLQKFLPSSMRAQVGTGSRFNGGLAASDSACSYTAPSPMMGSGLNTGGPVPLVAPTD